jgi:hypothetical protein
MPLYMFSMLATPSKIIKQIQNLQRSFLWGGPSRERKWALVAWDKVWVGGLGIKDHLTTSKVLTARTWWKWIK